MIDKKTTEQFKKKLEEKKLDIEKELKSHKDFPDFGSDVDPDEETDETAAFGNQLSVNQTMKVHLADIDFALRKIREGKYGVCEKCKKEISLEILEVDPESRLCRECKKQK